MNTKLESVLTSLTVGLLFMIMVMIASNVFGQDRFLCTIGTSFQDASMAGNAFPQVQKTESENKLRYSSEDFTVEYEFENGCLSHMQIERQFHTEKLAWVSLESHLLQVQRLGATLVTLNSDPRHKVYCAIGQEAAYELELVSEGAQLQRLRVRSWQREEEGGLGNNDAIMQDVFRRKIE